MPKLRVTALAALLACSYLSPTEGASSVTVSRYMEAISHPIQAIKDDARKIYGAKTQAEFDAAVRDLEAKSYDFSQVQAPACMTDFREIVKDAISLENKLVRTWAVHAAAELSRLYGEVLKRLSEAWNEMTKVVASNACGDSRP